MRKRQLQDMQNNDVVYLEARILDVDAYRSGRVVAIYIPALEVQYLAKETAECLLEPEASPRQIKDSFVAGPPEDLKNETVIINPLQKKIDYLNEEIDRLRYEGLHAEGRAQGLEIALKAVLES